MRRSKRGLNCDLGWGKRRALALRQRSRGRALACARDGALMGFEACVDGGVYGLLELAPYRLTASREAEAVSRIVNTAVDSSIIQGFSHKCIILL